MFPVGHGPDGTDGAAYAWKAKCATGLAESFVKAVFVDGAVAAAGVDKVSVGGPAGVHAPWRGVA